MGGVPFPAPGIHPLAAPLLAPASRPREASSFLSRDFFSFALPGRGLSPHSALGLGAGFPPLACHSFPRLAYGWSGLRVCPGPSHPGDFLCHQRPAVDGGAGLAAALGKGSWGPRLRPGSMASECASCGPRSPSRPDSSARRGFNHASADRREGCVPPTGARRGFNHVLRSEKAVRPLVIPGRPVLPPAQSGE